MPGDGLEADDGQAGGEGFHAREPARVLYEGVGGRHQRGHLVGPPEDVAPGAPLELAAQLLVVAAHGQRRIAPGVEDGVKGLGYVADAPGARDHEDQALVVIESEGAAGRRPVGQAGMEPLGDHGPGCAGRSSRASRSRFGRLRVHAHVQVDAGVRPQRVDGEVGDEGGDGRVEATLLAGTPEHERGHRIGRDDDVGLGLAHPAHHPPVGQQVDEGAEGLEDERQQVPEAVRRLV